MNTYLFTGLVSEYHQGHFVNGCANTIVYGGDETAARKTFEQSLLARNRDGNPDLTRIELVLGAPVLEELLSETGGSPLNCLQVVEESARILEATEVDEQGQGYWVDFAHLVRPDNLPTGIEWLQRELPEDIRSGLNWSADKTYFFLISVLSPPTVPAEPTEDFESEGEGGEDQNEPADLALRCAEFPQLAAKELAVVARARNSVVAAWLWRRHAAGTPLARHPIRVDALCEVQPAMKEGVG